MHVHPKASGHEAHGGHLVAGSRKKPHNPDEVGAVKDHFSEGRQQDNKRQPPRQNLSPEPAPAPFVVAEPPLDPRQASHALAAQQAALALDWLLKDAAPEAGKEVLARVAAPPEPVKDPSLDDLLALMMRKL